MLIDELGYGSTSEMINVLYNVEDKSLKQIGDFLGVSYNAVKYWMDELDMPVRPRGGANHCGPQPRSARTQIRSYNPEKIAKLTVSEVARKFRVTEKYVYQIGYLFKIPYKRMTKGPRE